MRHGCVNCLEPTGRPGEMCDKCKEIVRSGWYGESMWSEVTDYDYGLPPVDEVYLHQLKERRTRMYTMARRRAKGLS